MYKNLGKQMKDGFAVESRRSEKDDNKMEEAMTAKMEEGLRNEQQARQQALKEIMTGLQKLKKTVGKWCRPTCRQSKKRSDDC